MFLVDALAAALIARLQKNEAPAAAKGERDTETHRLTGIEQHIHSGIDFRGVVPLLFVGGIFFGPVKDAQTLIPDLWFIIATWACILGASAASVSIWASLRVVFHAPRKRATDPETELDAMHKTTRRKVISYDIALMFGMTALFAYGIGVTITIVNR